MWKYQSTSPGTLPRPRWVCHLLRKFQPSEHGHLESDVLTWGLVPPARKSREGVLQYRKKERKKGRLLWMFWLGDVWSAGCWTRRNVGWADFLFFSHLKCFWSILTVLDDRLIVILYIKVKFCLQVPHFAILSEMSLVFARYFYFRVLARLFSFRQDLEKYPTN